MKLEFGTGQYMVGAYEYEETDIVGVFVYDNPLKNPAVGQRDENAPGKTPEELGAILKLEFANTQSIDVWIRALEHAKETISQRSLGHDR